MTLIEQYAELTAQKKLIDAQLDEMAEKILEKMKTEQIGTIKADFGTFTKVQKFVYEYSEDFKTKETELKGQIKALKEEEESKLTPSIKEHLTFRIK